MGRSMLTAHHNALRQASGGYTATSGCDERVHQSVVRPTPERLPADLLAHGASRNCPIACHVCSAPTSPSLPKGSLGVYDGSTLMETVQ